MHDCQKDEWVKLTCKEVIKVISKEKVLRESDLRRVLFDCIDMACRQVRTNVAYEIETADKEAAKEVFFEKYDLPDDEDLPPAA
jgi:hypothetical protein